MNGIELYILGRRLMKLGQEAMPRAGFRRLPSSVQTILIDISEHPDSSISQIVARTGFPQSLVSAAVARLRDGGALQTAVDPADRRRTLVRMSADIPARMAQAPADPVGPVLAAALGIDEPAELAEVVSMLTVLAERFAAAAQRPTHGGAGHGAGKDN
ncbi:MAG TPA: helix-turn-helix domain-containing protein [Streptosporangiaceae bacterium]|nr:helix-turn-helix domain-containing protein [Streptosporangiaceae bacterium]